jgi:hypothetical protein
LFCLFDAGNDLLFIAVSARTNVSGARVFFVETKRVFLIFRSRRNVPREAENSYCRHSVVANLGAGAGVVFFKIKIA